MPARNHKPVENRFESNAKPLAKTGANPRQSTLKRRARRDASRVQSNLIKRQLADALKSLHRSEEIALRNSQATSRFLSYQASIDQQRALKLSLELPTADHVPVESVIYAPIELEILAQMTSVSPKPSTRKGSKSVALFQKPSRGSPVGSNERGRDYSARSAKRQRPLGSPTSSRKH